MRELLALGWIAWAIAATSLIVRVIAEEQRNAADRARTLIKRSDELTVSDLRVLMLGSRLDPIERHQHATTMGTYCAAVAFSGLLLALLTRL